MYTKKRYIGMTGSTLAAELRWLFRGFPPRARAYAT